MGNGLTKERFSICVGTFSWVGIHGYSNNFIYQSAVFIIITKGQFKSLENQRQLCRNARSTKTQGGDPLWLKLYSYDYDYYEIIALFRGARRPKRYM